MIKKNYKGRCERRTIDKAEGVCRFYSKIQSVYADKLVENEQVVEIHCNVLLEGLDTEAYAIKDTYTGIEDMYVLEGIV